MKPARPHRAKRGSDALEQFLKLTKADALLFYVVEISKEMGLKEVVAPLENARTDIALRLEACQDSAYVQMKLRNRRPATRTPSSRRSKAKRRKW